MLRRRWRRVAARSKVVLPATTSGSDAATHELSENVPKHEEPVIYYRDRETVSFMWP